MPTPFESPPRGPRRVARPVAVAAAALLAAVAGCGEPTERELKNRQEFEMLLTAVSLKDKAELEKDARRLESRHDSGELSDGAYEDLRAIIKRARDGDWAGAEGDAYRFREARPYFR